MTPAAKGGLSLANLPETADSESRRSSMISPCTRTDLILSPAAGLHPKAFARAKIRRGGISCCERTRGPSGPSFPLQFVAVGQQVGPPSL